MSITPPAAVPPIEPADFRGRDAGNRPSGYPLTNWGRAAVAVTVLFLVCGFALSVSLKPDRRGLGTHQSLGLPPCGVRVLFGVVCPSCGSTTSFAHFVRGEWWQAVQANMSAFGLAMVCAAFIPWGMYSAATGRLWQVTRPDRTALWVLIGLGVLSIGQWGVRLLIPVIAGS